jgi:hypothetical protein
MKTGPVFLAVLLTGAVCVPLAGTGQAFSGAAPSAGLAGEPGAELAASNAPDSGMFAEGTRAINEGRWADAQAIFSKVAAKQSDHADGALYWKAYAENKLGQSAMAITTCADLEREHPASSWVHECGALEIEIRARSGQPVQPKAGDDDDLKLLALNSLMQKDEPQALVQIQQILNGDASEKLKKEAMFILGQHYSNATYPQIVRVSYVEGDVRITRGKEIERNTGSTWEQAVADLPLEAGFSLVTGAGRAEIEFENASTLYLGENSVLTFNDLHTTAGIPFTEVALLSGTVSLHIHPYVPGEVFLLKTPTDNFVSRYPDKSYARIGSYTDAMTVTPLEGATLRLPGVPKETIASGRTLTYLSDRLSDPAGSSDAGAFAEWDKWVAERVAQRSAAMSQVMEASGLTTPIPGLAEMAGQGKFFDCAPYGTCWEPAANEAGQQAENVQGEAMLSTPRPSFGTISVQDLKQEKGSVTGSGTKRFAIPRQDDEDWFPCSPTSLRYGYLLDPGSARRRLLNSAVDLDPYPYNWAVCHAGSWIHRNHRYVWVVGHKRHHLEPVRWVKSGHKVAFVPIHPFDVKNLPPINRKEHVFGVSDRNGLTIEKIKFDPDRPIELLKAPPREFSKAVPLPLPKADAPHMEAHAIRDTMTAKYTVARAPGIPINFDHKSQSFTTPRQVMQGNHTVTVSTPIGNRGGNLQAHSGGGGSIGGGGGSHSASGGSSGSSGGGGSHGGGSSVSSSSGSSSGGASAGGGGGHH